MSKLVEEIPDVALFIFNLCVTKGEQFTRPSYGETNIKRFRHYELFPFERHNSKYCNVQEYFILGFAMLCRGVLLYN